MFLVISPAKSLNEDSVLPPLATTQPAFLDQSADLIEVLRQLSPQAVGSLMSISDPLAVLNVERFAQWARPFSNINARPAVLTFDGDVYGGLDAASLSVADLTWAQSHLGILSGLYGLLRPLDLLQAYRLEMGTKLANGRGKDLYQFWGDTITDAVNQRMAEQGDAVLVNLASDEYFKAVRPKRLQGRIITPVFQDWKGGTYKIISFYAKRARGLMSRYVIQHRLTEPQALQDFDVEGYAFDAAASKGDSWVFRRRVEA